MINRFKWLDNLSKKDDLMISRLKGYYSGLSTEELEMEKDSLLENLRDLYRADIELFKSLGCKSVRYNIVDLDISVDILTSLGYEFFIGGSDLYLKLDSNSDLKENIRLAKKYKLLNNLITVLLACISVACFSLMMYNFCAESVHSKSSDLALCLAFISLLLYVLSVDYIKKSKECVGVSRL